MAENLVATIIRVKEEPLLRGLSKALQVMFDMVCDEPTRGRVAVALDAVNGAIYRRVVRRGVAALMEVGP